ncbi:MAG: pyruvate dehydrogenase (acetyl-transferring), homodimeric type, partial [Candidatus Nitrotoga sp.]
AWAAGDLRARGFLLGGTAGRTTLNGEGLQHQDGHSHLVAATIPNCIAYDPAFAYELAVIIQDGMRRMYQEQEDVYYYITVMNENYAHPAMPANAEAGIIKGMYLFQEGRAKNKKSALKVQLLGSGTILREVIAAAELLEKDFDVISDIWSVTSFNELRRDGLDCERWNMLNPEAAPRVSYVEQMMKDRTGPIIAATDYMKSYADQIRPFLPSGNTQQARYKVLGTDGFGRSDTRKKLRHFFEVNRYFVTIAALKSLAEAGVIANSEVSRAIKLYNIAQNKPNPTTV